MSEFPIAEIKVGTRHRKDLGDVRSLADSIANVGLLHPVVVNSLGNLVAGERRLAAVRLLGWTSVPVTVAETVDDATKALIAERDENTCRKEMVFSELLPLKHAIEELERPKAQERKAEGQQRGRAIQQGKSVGSNLEPTIKSRTAVAKALGKSATTLDKVEEVHEIAEDPETPEPVREVARAAMAEMDRTGKVDGLHKQVVGAKQAQALHEFLDADIDLKVLELRRRFHNSIARLGKDLLTYNPDSLGDALDEMGWDALDRMWDSLEEWFDAVRSRRPDGGLHVMQGGK